MGQLFTVAGAIGTAVFGALGIFTNFENKSKLGRIATAIVILGLLTTATLSLIGGYVSSKKSESEEADRHSRLLTQIWKEGTRVHSGNLQILVEYEFHTESMRNAPEPALMGRQWDMRLAISPKNSASKRVIHESLLYIRPEVLLSAKRQESNWIAKVTVDSTHYTQRSLFSVFTGDLRSFDELAQWRGKVLKLHLSARGEEAERVFDFILGKNDEKTHDDQARNGKEAAKRRLRSEGKRLFERLHGFEPKAQSEQLPFESITLTPCQATATVFIAGRPIAKTRAQVLSVRTWDEDVQGKTIADFIEVEVGETPVLDATSVAATDTSGWRWTGISLMIVMCGTLPAWSLIKWWIAKEDTEDQRETTLSP